MLVFIFFMLVFMGLASLYVGIERMVTFTIAKSQSRLLAAALTKPLADGDVSAGMKICAEKQYKNSYLGHLLQVGLAELAIRFDDHGVKAAERALRRQNSQERLHLRKGMNVLATVGSTAPFVGLVGTIVGIINAFVGMAESGSGGLASVSAGIAEALVATAVGIFVAIIGVWLFNYFTSHLEAIDNDIEVAIDEFMDWCEKRLISPEDTPTQEARAD